MYIEGRKKNIDGKVTSHVTTHIQLVLERIIGDGFDLNRDYKMESFKG